MNKAQLIEHISEKTKTTKTQSELILDAAIRVIQEALQQGEDVKLVGFGTFSKISRKPREGRNPKTGKTVKIPSSYVARFKPGKDLRDALN